jgi:hypothetical protein
VSAARGGLAVPLVDLPLAGVTGDELAGLDQPGAGIQLVGTVRIAAGSSDVMGALRLLREASAAAVPVRWDVEIGPGVPGWILTHLPPPRRADGLPPELLTTWRERFRYGRCYYRRGPGFVSLYDDRRDPPVRAILTDPAAIDAVERLDRPADVGSLPDAVRRAVPGLHQRGLLLAVDGHALALPWRLRRWPIPCTL